MDELTGKTLNQYRILGPLGEGGMAAVYKAYQASMDREVAIKVLPRQYAAQPGFLERFQREAKVIASLEHPHIIPVHDFGESEGYTYLVMRYLTGGTLAQRLGHGPLAPAEATRLISQIASALDYAHERNVIHRDIKPTNVLLDSQGNVLLTDFGIAKMLEQTTQLTASGAFLGTPKYASPEQGQGQELSGRSDAYSLGVILYEMATGRLPFEAETPLALIFKHANDPLPLPSTLNPSIPESLEHVILKAMAKDPADRYASAGELAWAASQAWSTAPEPAGEAEEHVPLQKIAVDASMPAAEAERLLTKMATSAPERDRGLRWLAAAGVLGLVLIAGVVGLAFALPQVMEMLSPQEVGRSPTSFAPPAAVDAISPTITATAAEPGPDAVIDAASAGRLTEQRLLTRGTVETLEFDPQGRTLAAAGGAGVWLYDLPALAAPRHLDHGAPVADLAFAPSGERLATAGTDTVARLWQTGDGQLLTELRGHTGSLAAVAWSPDGERVVTAALDGTLIVWRASSGAIEREIPDLTQGTVALDWLPDSQRFVSGSLDGTVRIWDAADGSMLALLGSLESPVDNLAVSRDGVRVAAGAGSTLRVWATGDGELLHELDSGGIQTVALAWSPDGARLAEASLLGFLGEVQIWDLEQDRVLEALDDVFLDAASALAWSPTGEHLAVATRRGRLVVWQGETGQLLHDARSHGYRATGVAWSPDGRELASSTTEGIVHFWDAINGGELRWAFLDAPVTGLAWSPSGGLLAAAATDGLAYLLQPAAAEVLDELRSGQRFAYSVGWSPDGQQLALGAEDGSLTVWEPATGRRLAELHGHQSHVNAVAWSPDSQLLLSASNDGTLHLWAPPAEQANRVFQFGAAQERVDWSPDGGYFASGTLDGRVLVWSQADELPLWEYPTESWVTGLDWSPAGEVLAVGTESGQLLLFDVRPERMLNGGASVLYDEHVHSGSISGLAFSSAGDRLATASSDGTVRLWGVP